MGAARGRSRGAQVAACALGLLTYCAPAAAADTPDRIALSVNGSTLTGTHGGAGAALGWLHNFDAQTVGSISADHQSLGNAQWTVGGLDGSLTGGAPGARYTLYGNARVGRGDAGGASFDYSVVDAGMIRGIGPRWSMQIEDRQIDVQTTHGNLVKPGMQYLWNQRVLASVSYSYSLSGNLGTRLTTARIQDTGFRVAPLVGIAFGQAAPQVLDLQTGAVLPGRQLKEAYAGLTVPVPSWRGDLTAVADYIDLAGSRRATLTVNYIFHVGRAN